jgi:hypothetical protein
MKKRTLRDGIVWSWLRTGWLAGSKEIVRKITKYSTFFHWMEAMETFTRLFWDFFLWEFKGKGWGVMFGLLD